MHVLHNDTNARTLKCLDVLAAKCYIKKGRQQKHIFLKKNHVSSLNIMLNACVITQ